MVPSVFSTSQKPVYILPLETLGTEKAVRFSQVNLFLYIFITVTTTRVQKPCTRDCYYHCVYFDPFSKLNILQLFKYY